VSAVSEVGTWALSINEQGQELGDFYVPEP